MVVISVKESGSNGGFLFETTTNTPNDVLISQLVSIHNLRLQSRLVCDAVRQLAENGPMKKPHNYSEKNEGESSENIHAKSISDMTYKEHAIEPQVLKTLLKTVQDIDDYTDKAQYQKRIPLNENAITDKLANVRGAVVMAFPMGLPEWDLAKVSLDSSIDGLKMTGVANEILDPCTASLWVAGKEFQRTQLVSDRLGKNEKTKVIGKLTKAGSGPPVREAAVTEGERKAMMAHYFKRQEDLKRLAESNEDDYLGSSWADPKAMKRNLQGVEQIKAPGLQF